MVARTRATSNIEGVIKSGRKFYKAQYDVHQGALYLEECNVDGSPKPQPGAGAVKAGRGAGDKEEIKNYEKDDTPAELKGMKVAIERVLAQNRISKPLHNQLKGKLDLKSRALSKSQTGMQSIRTKKGKVGALGYNVILLVDNSGSMSGDRIALANSVASGLHRVLRATEGINVKVLAFEDKVRLVADWDDKTCQHMGAGGSNCDAAACYIAMFKHMAAAPNPEYRNILLVISDGEPCPGDADDNTIPELDVFKISDNREIAVAVNRWGRQTGTYVAGLGIQNNSTQIPNSRRIDKLEDVQKALIQALKGAIDHE
jgi:Mg-chelatase subunit ChlD